MLVGLIPGWGVVPKAAIAYAGTAVVGNVVLQWYLTGRHITKDQVRQLYSQAFARGKQMVTRIRREPKQLAPGERKKRRREKTAKAPVAAGMAASSVDSLAAEVSGDLQTVQQRGCTNCGRMNAADASFCQYCGKPLGTQA
jgi:zinc-ribbon domain